MSAPVHTWAARDWLVEQHIDLPGLAGRWLRDERFVTRDDADGYVARLLPAASPLETYRVRFTGAAA